MRYSPKREDDKWLQYDKTRMEHQSKTIVDLQNEIAEYQKRERAFLIHLHLKEKQTKMLKKEIKELVKRQSEKLIENKNEILVDQLLLNELKILKNVLKDKEDKLLAKDDELASLQTTQNK
jgi:hypothetical protein